MKRHCIIILAGVFLFLFPFNGNTQSHKDYFECGTETDPDSYLKDFSYGNNDKLTDIIIQENIPIPEGYFKYLGIEKPEDLYRSIEPKKTYIPIKLWVYRDDYGTGNINTIQAYEIIDKLNQIYANNTNFEFYLLCDISFINNLNYAYYVEHFETYTLNNKIPNVINVHVVMNFLPEIGLAGKANLPWSDSGIGQMLGPRAFSCAVKYFPNTDFSAIAMAHEIGHTLGLYHTHQAGRTSLNTNAECGDCYQESVSRSKKQGPLCVSTIGKKKCEVNGDFLCDTAADPFINFQVYDCNYIGGGTDNWGKAWIPNGENIMSYTDFYCMTYFTPMQVAKMTYYKDLMDIQYPIFNISGPNYLCAGEPTNFTVNSLPGSSYHWEVLNNVNILGGQGTNSITVETNDGSVMGEISVTPSCNGKPATHILSSPNYTPITGPEEVCILHIGTTYTATYIPGATYSWTITNGTITSGQGTNQVEVSLTSHPSNMSLLQVSTGLCNSSGGGAQYIIHIPPGPDCKGEIIPEIGDLNEEVEIILYPNPSKRNVTILLSENGNYDLYVMDIFGQIRHSQKNLKITKHTINTESLTSGVYFVCLTSSITGKSTIKRIIIKK